MQRPLATVVIGGLIVSTLLTLSVVPSFTCMLGTGGPDYVGTDSGRQALDVLGLTFDNPMVHCNSEVAAPLGSPN